MKKKSNFLIDFGTKVFLPPALVMLIVMFGSEIHKQNKFRSRIAYHNEFGNKPNKWLSSEMAENVAELQDSMLSADFKHYVDLSRYFQTGRLEYDVNKKDYDHAQTVNSQFHVPLNNTYKNERLHFGRMAFKTNGEFLDSLDKCVAKLDQRYKELVAAKRTHKK